MKMEAACGKCAYFESQSQISDGLCRYNPPVSQPNDKDHGLWPVVSGKDWCGHFEKGGAQVAAE